MGGGGGGGAAALGSGGLLAKLELGDLDLTLRGKALLVWACGAFWWTRCSQGSA